MVVGTTPGVLLGSQLLTTVLSTVVPSSTSRHSAEDANSGGVRSALMTKSTPLTSRARMRASARHKAGRRSKSPILRFPKFGQSGVAGKGLSALYSRIVSATQE